MYAFKLAIHEHVDLLLIKYWIFGDLIVFFRRASIRQLLAARPDPYYVTRTRPVGYPCHYTRVVLAVACP